jgi:hypothetical protein
MQELASSPGWDAFLKECEQGLHGPEMSLKALTWLSDRGYGKPAQEVNVSGKGLTVILADTLPDR